MSLSSESSVNTRPIDIHKYTGMFFSIDSNPLHPWLQCKQETTRNDFSWCRFTKLEKTGLKVKPSLTHPKHDGNFSSQNSCLNTIIWKRIVTTKNDRSGTWIFVLEICRRAQRDRPEAKIPWEVTEAGDGCSKSTRKLVDVVGLLIWPSYQHGQQMELQQRLWLTAHGGK